MNLLKRFKKDKAAKETMPKQENIEAVDDETDVEAVMRKYDRESNTRVWEGAPKYIIAAIMSLFSMYCIAMTLLSTELPETKLCRFIAFVIIIG